MDCESGNLFVGLDVHKGSAGIAAADAPRHAEIALDMSAASEATSRRCGPARWVVWGQGAGTSWLPDEAARPARPANDEEQPYSIDGCNNDAANETANETANEAAAWRDAKDAEQEPAEKCADYADQQVTDAAEAAALDQGTGQLTNQLTNQPATTPTTRNQGKFMTRSH